MPEYLSPGVYVEEVDTGSKPIEGVSTSTAGMVGITERGPINIPILVTSFGDYNRWFGGHMNIADLGDGNHGYLSYAVEGFFRNGGKRLYVVRVIDTNGSSNAMLNLHTRGDDQSASTLLLRRAGELSGTLANTPLLYCLDTTDLATGMWVRLGSGSTAEYRRIADVGLPADNTHVSLDFPLSFSHITSADNVEQFARSVDGAYAAGFTLSEESSGGDAVIGIEGASADITVLEGVTGQLLEIGASGSAEYRFAVEVAVTASGEALIRLSAPLVMAYDAATAVTPMEIGAATGTASLDMASAAGNGIIYVNDRNSVFNDRTNLVIIDPGDAEFREVRRIGSLTRLDLDIPAYESYAAGTVATHLTPFTRTIILNAAASIGDTEITLDSTENLNPGTPLFIGSGAGMEDVEIQSVDSATVVTLSAALTLGHAVGDTVIPEFYLKSLENDARAGSSVISLDNRFALSQGDVIRIGEAPVMEYVTVDSLPNATGVGDDPGMVLLTHPLMNDYDQETPVSIQQILVTPATQPAVLALTSDADADFLLVLDGDGYADGDLIALTTPSIEQFYHIIESSETCDPALVTLENALDRAHGAGSMVVERDPMVEIRALDPGVWGDRLRISVADETMGLVSRSALSSIIDATHVRVSSLNGMEAGTVLELLDPLDNNEVVGDPLKVRQVDRSNNMITLEAPGISVAQQGFETDAVAAGTHLNLRSREFCLTVYLIQETNPARPGSGDKVLNTESFRHLSMDPRHSRYIETVIGNINGEPRLSDGRPEGDSAFIRVDDLAGTENELRGIRLGPENMTDTLPNGTQRPAKHSLSGGGDSVSTLTDDHYLGEDNVDPESRTGLQSLKNLDNISIVACPGVTSPAVQQGLIDHCELMRYRFAVLDALKPPDDSIPEIQVQRQQFDTKYAAMYHPWLLTPSQYASANGKILDFAIPPSGHMLGIYARTDIERGVHKAPANEVVRGITGLQRKLNASEHDILNPYPVNINVIRDFRKNNRGIRVWGGRVITSDSDWKYINVRRLMIYIEASIERGLQWVVFEPNAEPLWARVKRSISAFLKVVWRNGALEGTVPEEAFFVKCDRETMTQTDIDSGRLICNIGVAPVKPAEFVIIRIGLWTAHADD